MTPVNESKQVISEVCNEYCKGSRFNERNNNGVKLR